MSLYSFEAQHIKRKNILQKREQELFRICVEQSCLQIKAVQLNKVFFLVEKHRHLINC